MDGDAAVAHHLEGVREENQVRKTATVEQEAKAKQQLERVLRLADGAHQTLDPVDGKVDGRCCMCILAATSAASASVAARKAVIVI